MKRFLVGGAMAAAILGLVPATAQAEMISNPCSRGPVPEWSLINGSTPEFVAFLQRVKPHMPKSVAKKIASQVCADLSLLGDTVALTHRTNTLIQQAGY